MEELFSVYGELDNVNLIMDRNTGRSKGFWFVKYINETDATNALEWLNNREIDGRELKITIARPKE
jgi:RNA recognition motif-containing protein